MASPPSTPLIPSPEVRGAPFPVPCGGELCLAVAPPAHSSSRIAASCHVAAAEQAPRNAPCGVPRGFPRPPSTVPICRCTFPSCSLGSARVAEDACEQCNVIQCEPGGVQVQPASLARVRTAGCWQAMLGAAVAMECGGEAMERESGVTLAAMLWMPVAFAAMLPVALQGKKSNPISLYRK